MIDNILLAVLLVLTNAFWAFQYHKLTNKLMSRTFWEYSQAKVIPKTEAQSLKDALSNVKVPEVTGPNELDSLDEMISRVMPI
jgi:hypothetical protein